MYADGNHKPEMALALTDFEALCGFAPLGELQHALCTVPELAHCLGDGLKEQVLALSEPDKKVGRGEDEQCAHCATRPA